jgi:hypothetical protein
MHAEQHLTCTALLSVEWDLLAECMNSVSSSLSSHMLHLLLKPLDSYHLNVVVLCLDSLLQVPKPQTRSRQRPHAA